MESFEPKGSSIIITSLVGDKIFRLVLPPDKAVEPGQHLRLEWDREKMHFFEKNSESLLI